jgi:hypothetical protein
MAKTRTPSQLGRLSRNKGKTYEQAVARGYRELYGERVKRGWQAREGSDAPDVEGVPYWVECKHHKKVSIRAAYEQAAEAAAAAGSKLPVVVHTKDNGAVPLVTLTEEAWLFVLKQLQKAHEDRVWAEAGLRTAQEAEESRKAVQYDYEMGLAEGRGREPEQRPAYLLAQPGDEEG